MTIGQKIKSLRTKKGITQSRLCGDKITRNMLSEIECDKATPSLSTLTFLAANLDVPVSYLISDDDDLFYFEKKKSIDLIKQRFNARDYKKCINMISALSGSDDELNYIMACCYFELGKKSILHASLRSGADCLKKSLEFCENTIYDTLRIQSLSRLYLALAKNIQSPLLEFDSESFAQSINEELDFELYKYLIQDYSFTYRNPILAKHVEAKELMKARKYREAVALLSEIENESKADYNAYVVFSVYTDLESCYKQLIDFENAYRYATKRLSLIEAFKS